VLIIDDSAAVCRILARELSACRGIAAEGRNAGPDGIRRLLEQEQFDVVVLDMDMPGQDGPALLGCLAEQQPVAVIVMSSVVTPLNQTAVRALEKGAVYAVHKPGGGFPVEETVGELSRLIREAAAVPVRRLYEAARRLEESGIAGRKVLRVPAVRYDAEGLVVAGASAGGVGALEELCSGFTAGFPPVLAVTGLPEYFTASFAERLGSMCMLRVKEAENGEVISGGTVYLVPGGCCMTVGMSGRGRTVRVMRKPAGRHPVDLLFRSAAGAGGRNCTGVLLSGTGGDGARGMMAVRSAGGMTIVPDAETCPVYDTPARALALGAVREIIPLPKIADRIAQENLSRIPVVRKE
jgi:two-component system chemotaxis response regulator CheB